MTKGAWINLFGAVFVAGMASLMYSYWQQHMPGFYIDGVFAACLFYGGIVFAVVGGIGIIASSGK